MTDLVEIYLTKKCNTINLGLNIQYPLILNKILEMDQRETMTLFLEKLFQLLLNN